MVVRGGPLFLVLVFRTLCGGSRWSIVPSPHFRTLCGGSRWPIVPSPRLSNAVWWFAVIHCPQSSSFEHCVVVRGGPLFPVLVFRTLCGGLRWPFVPSPRLSNAARWFAVAHCSSSSDRWWQVCVSSGWPQINLTPLRPALQNTRDYAAIAPGVSVPQRVFQRRLQFIC